MVGQEEQNSTYHDEEAAPMNITPPQQSPTSNGEEPLQTTPTVISSPSVDDDEMTEVNVDDEGNNAGEYVSRLERAGRTFDSQVLTPVRALKRRRDVRCVIYDLRRPASTCMHVHLTNILIDIISLSKTFRKRRKRLNSNAENSSLPSLKEFKEQTFCTSEFCVCCQPYCSR
jgi:hypothetical protein